MTSALPLHLQGRDEHAIIAKTPIDVKLGDKTYKVPILCLVAAAEWREKFVALVDKAGADLQGDGTGINFLRGLRGAFLKFPEKILELLFEYAAVLKEDSEYIMANATDEQVGYAFGQVVKVGFPYSGELHLISQTVSLAAATLPVSAKSTS